MRLPREYILPFASAALLVVLMFLFCIHVLGSVYQDIGRHITLGRIIWETGAVPATNLFSYTNPGFPFINHHWLGEVVLYGGSVLFGLRGLILAKAVLIAAAYGLALAAAWRPRLAVPAMLVGLVSIGIMLDRTDVRPEALSFIFLGWFLFVLYRKPRSRLVWTLPLVQAVWVNTHIYFFMGPVVFLAWWIGEIVVSGRSALFGRRHLGLAGALTLATFCNPHGIFGALYPLNVFSNYGYSVVENQTPFFLAAYNYPPLTFYAVCLGIFLAVASFIVNRRHIRRNVMGAVLVAVGAVLSLMMVRNYPLLGLIIMPVILTNLDQAGWHSRNRQVLGWGLVFLALLGISVVTDQFYRQAGLRSPQFGLEVPSGPQEPVDFFRRAGLRGPIFNNFDVGSFLIWKLPEEPVFIDGRPEAYPADFIQNVYIKMQESPEAWKKYSEQYRINTIFWNYNDITPWSRTFVARIVTDPEWIPVYRNHGILILVKDTAANAESIRTYRLR